MTSCRIRSRFPGAELFQCIPSQFFTKFWYQLSFNHLQLLLKHLPSPTRNGHCNIGNEYRDHHLICPSCNLTNVCRSTCWHLIYRTLTLTLTIEHILLECTVLQQSRDKYYTVDSLRNLFEMIPEAWIIEFLREAGFYYLIWMARYPTQLFISYLGMKSWDLHVCDRASMITHVDCIKKSNPMLQQDMTLLKYNYLIFTNFVCYFHSFTLTIYVLLECAVLQECRDEYYRVDSLNTLFEKIPETCIVEFLREVGFFYLIWCNLLTSTGP